MSLVHLHLLLNHLPVLGVPLTLILYALGAFKRSDELKRASYLFAIGFALIIVPVYLTGEPAEHAVEHLPGVTEALIEAHEEPALIALIATLLAGLLGASQFFSALRGRPFLTRAYIVALVVSMGALAYTAMHGGEIRHTEIRSNPMSDSESIRH